MSMYQTLFTFRLNVFNCWLFEHVVFIKEHDQKSNKTQTCKQPHSICTLIHNALNKHFQLPGMSKY